MSHIVLKARVRKQTGKQLRQLKTENKIPAVVYGPKSKNVNLELNYTDLIKAYNEASQSTLVDLIIDEQPPIKVLIHDVTTDVLTDKFNHIDFYRLDMDKKLQLEVELEFIGESPAVKEQHGELIKTVNKITVECLPRDLVKKIDVDISKLKNLGDRICAKDISLPSGLSLVTDGDVNIIGVEEIVEQIIEQPSIEKEKQEGKEETKAGEENKEEGKDEDKKQKHDGEDKK